MTAANNSLEFYLTALAANDVNDAQIFDFLCKVDSVRLSKLLGRLAKVDALAPPTGRAARAEFETRRTRVKGRLFEDAVAEALRSVRCFEIYDRIRTPTNELDILITLGPTANFLPAMRDWGSHLVCECKYHKTYVGTDWVTKLNSVMQTHGASVGFLISKKGLAISGSAASVRETLRMIAAMTPARYVLCFDVRDLQDCASGVNFLKLVSNRYIELRTGVQRLALAGS